MRRCRKLGIDTARATPDSRVHNITCPDFPHLTRQHTLNHADCPACEMARQMRMNPEGFSALTLSEAFPLWLESRTKLTPRTRQDYESYFKALAPFFARLPLNEIHIGHIAEYRKMRLKTAGASRINHEINTLQQILNRAGLWAKIAPWYETLPVPKSVGIALEPEEEQHLFQVAARKPRWKVAYLCSVLSRNTCAGPGEIRNLRLRSIDTREFSWIQIEQCVKTKFRIRKLICNEHASWALKQLFEMAEEKGAYLPDHYLLPHRAHKMGAKPDPTVPMGSWKKAWGALRLEAAKKYPRLGSARFLDWRHTADTRLLEDPAVPYNAIEHFMGHQVGSKTKRLYDHIRNVTLQIASNALSSGHVEKKAVEDEYQVIAGGRKQA